MFVDESGNLGVEGDYFVLAALVFRSSKSEAKVRRLVRREQRLDAMGGELLMSRSELKFSKMKFEQRQRILVKLRRIGRCG